MTENLPTTVFDRIDPKIGKTVIIAAIIAMSLLVVLIGVQAGFGRVRPDAAPSPVADLQTLRSSEEKALTSYRYIDRAQGTVVLPVDRAMELLIKEAAEGKLPYSTASTEIKSDAAGREGK